MLRKSLVMKLFDAFSIGRWNDQIRPIDLVEMDKTAHKMAIAYCLARYEEDEGHAVAWHDLVRGGVFELLRRVVLSDIKSPVYRKIRAEHPEVYRQLSEWVFRQLDPVVTDPEIKADLKRHLVDDDLLDGRSRRILDAAHFFASLWEFRMLQRFNPDSSQTTRIDRLMTAEIEPHLELAGIRKLVSRHPVADFVDLFGQLRFQVRWGQTPRIPQTSVLGHSMMVASLTYFLCREVRACDRRVRNGFFGGLFHDLPESVTRDIISPVKGAVPDLPEAIGKIERELAAAEIYPLVEPHWRSELEYFTTDEFASKVRAGDEVHQVTSDDINARFNADVHDPIDGELIRVADHLAAFVEAFKALDVGIRTRHLVEGMQGLSRTWQDRKVAGIDVGAIYADFG
jgi:putative hydrolases of HD superfamily